MLIGQTSSWTKINAGVQQGSILGSSIFLIYKNNSSDKLSFKAKIFPDNTAVFSVVHEPSKQDQGIVGRGFLTPLFYEDSPTYPPFFKFCPNDPPPSSASTFNPNALFVPWFLWLNGWSCHIWFIILLSDIMDLYMSRFCTLVPEWPCSVFYATRNQVYRGLAHNVIFCLYSDLISHKDT